MSPQQEPITNEHARKTCRIGQGSDCCRYLTMGVSGWSCEKHGSARAEIDRRVALGLFVAQSDNCEGRQCR